MRHFGKLAIRLNLLGDANKSLEWKVEEKKSTRVLPLDQAELDADFDQGCEEMNDSINLKHFEEIEKEMRNQEHSVAEDSLIQV